MKKSLFILALSWLLCLSAGPALAKGQGAVSLFGGLAMGVGSDPIKGRDGFSSPSTSSMDNAFTGGAEAFYAFGRGLELGLGLQYMDFTTQASRSGGGKVDWLSISATPVYLVGRYRGGLAKPVYWFGEAGLGYIFTGNEKESGLKSMQSGLGETVNVSMSDTWAFFLGAGIGYKLAPNWMLSLGARYWWMEIDSDLSSAKQGVISKDTYELNNLQVLLGLSYWFNLP